MKIAIILAVLVATAHAEPEALQPEPALSLKRLYVRAGYVHFSPRARSHELVLSNVHGPASLVIMDGPIAGSGTTIDDLSTVAVVIGYTLTDRWSLETIVGPPLHAQFRATGTLANMSIGPTALGEPTGVPALGPQLGESDALPPQLIAIFHPVELGPVRPYVGAGVTAMFLRNAHATNPVLTEVATPVFHIDPSYGVLFDAGIDARVWRRLTARLDIKYALLSTTHARVEHIVVATPDLPLFQQADVGTANMDITMRPIVVQLATGWDF